MKTVNTLIQFRPAAFFFAAVLTSGAAQAHYLWIEPSDTGARLYYGEADNLLKEKSPGKLDNIKAPRAFAMKAAKIDAVSVSRTEEFFAIDSGKAAPTVLVAEESLEVRDLSKHGLGIAKSNYYARYGQPATAGASPLALDVQARGANALVVSYRGQPLKDAKLEVIAPNAWVQEHKTDAQGAVKINAPWRGQYVVHVLHVDRSPGEFGGQKYDNLRNHFTYTFLKADGADPGPALAPQYGAD